MRNLLLLIIFPILQLTVLAQSNSPTDAVYINGRVHTVDAKDSTVSAFAVKAGRFISVGSKTYQAISQGDYIEKNTKIIIISTDENQLVVKKT